jgi:EmrB/QacA subfamily drug resistance transporter
MATKIYIPAPAGARETRGAARRWWVLAVASVAQLMVVLDVTVVNIALPSAQRALAFSDADRQWVVTAYALAFGSLLLIGGKLSDLLGRNRTFMAGLAGFAAASALAGAAPTFAVLAAGRAAQGAFGALLAPAALAIVTATFAGSPARGRAFGAVAGIAGAVGLLLGGLLTEHLNWRWTLYVNLAFAAIGLIGAAAFLRRPDRPAHRPKIDLPGTALVSAGLFLLVFGLSRAQAGGWHAPASWLSLTGAAALLAAFAGWQTRAAAPLLPLRVLADRDRAASIIALTLASAGIYSVFLFLTYYLQTVQAYTPVRTGLAFLPMVATTIAGSVLGANVLLTRIGPRLTLPLGMLAGAAGMAWLTRLTVTSSYPGAVLGPLLVLGLGLGLIFAPAISLGTARLRGQDTGVGSALVNTTQQVGGAVGIALLSTLAASAATSYLRPRAALTPALLQHAAVHGYATAYWAATAIFAAGALLTALLYRSGRTDPAVLASTVPA